MMKVEHVIDYGQYGPRWTELGDYYLLHAELARLRSIIEAQHATIRELQQTVQAIERGARETS